MTQELVLIFRFVDWVIVPIALLGLLGFAWQSVPEKAKDPTARQSANYGRWLGVVLFVIFVLTRRHSQDQFNLRIPTYPFSPLVLGFGAILGAFVPSGFDLLRRFRVLGLLTAPLVAASLSALYSYFFIARSRGVMVFLALGCAAGALAYRVVVPNSFGPPSPPGTEPSPPDPKNPT
jgi:hypothetical protein